jgi:hypothetical protein
MKHAKRVHEKGSKNRVNSQTESPSKEIKPGDGIKPFGPIEPTHEINSARYLICDEWKKSLGAKACDALGGILPSLYECI